MVKSTINQLFQMSLIQVLIDVLQKFLLLEKHASQIDLRK